MNKGKIREDFPLFNHHQQINESIKQRVFEAINFPLP